MIATTAGIGAKGKGTWSPKENAFQVRPRVCPTESRSNPSSKAGHSTNHTATADSEPLA